MSRIQFNVDDDLPTFKEHTETPLLGALSLVLIAPSIENDI